MSASAPDRLNRAPSHERHLTCLQRASPGLATLHEAGAVILLAAPGFYHGAETVDDLVDFVVARCLDQLGLEHQLTRRWGDRS